MGVGSAQRPLHLQLADRSFMLRCSRSADSLGQSPGARVHPFRCPGSPRGPVGCWEAVWLIQLGQVGVCC